MKSESIAGIDSEQLLARAADIEIASRSLKAMSHPLRLKILCTLGSREVCVQGIVENVGTSQSNISQHLAILRAGHPNRELTPCKMRTYVKFFATC